MSRVGLVVAAFAAAGAVTLGGCSSMPDWTPDWMSSRQSTPAMQALRFESDPPGADVRTAQGQTCLTPCVIAVPSETQPVSFTKVGFVPQTVQVTAGEPPDHHFWENPPPTLTPNPVQVVLQAVPRPVKPIYREKRRKPVSSRTRTAAKMTRVQSDPPSAFDPPATQPAASPFPPPPPTGQ
jgi:hypothetical protein